MITRRDFALGSASVALTATCPFAAAANIELTTRRPIGDSADSLPVVGLGNSRSFAAKDLSNARRLIDIFVAHGGGYIDLRGQSIFNVGKIAQETDSVDALFLGNYLGSGSSDETRASAATIAQAQGKKILDLAQSSDLTGYLANSSRFRALKEEGFARYIGVARIGRNVIEPMIKLINERRVDFIQINYSLVEPDAAKRLLPLAQDKGVAVVINRPFINGKYFDLVRDVPLPEWVAEFDCHSWAQFSLKFILANPAVNCVLTETTNPKHATENLRAGIGRLPDAATRKRMLEVIKGLL